MFSGWAVLFFLFPLVANALNCSDLFVDIFARVNAKDVLVGGREAERVDPKWNLISGQYCWVTDSWGRQGLYGYYRTIPSDKYLVDRTREEERAEDILIFERTLSGGSSELYSIRRSQIAEIFVSGRIRDFFSFISASDVFGFQEGDLVELRTAARVGFVQERSELFTSWGDRVFYEEKDFLEVLRGKVLRETADEVVLELISDGIWMERYGRGTLGATTTRVRRGGRVTVLKIRETDRLVDDWWGDQPWTRVLRGPAPFSRGYYGREGIRQRFGDD